MKKIAILYSGHPRFFGITLQNHLNQFKNDENYTFDLFGHFWKTEEEIYKMGYIIHHDIKFIEQILKKHFKSYIYENYFPCDMIMSIDKVIKLVHEYENKNNFKYDIIIKIRSDLFLFNDIKSIIDLNIENCFYHKHTNKNKWVNDIFYILDIEAFNKFSNLYNYSLNSNFICHELLYNYIKVNNIKIKELKIYHILIKKIFLDEMNLKNNIIYEEDDILIKMNEYNLIFKKYIKQYHTNNKDDHWTDIDHLYAMYNYRK